eukprot:CAMPEP_0174372106 /NCGR_PEP_ID=MMETSP0811_2-20130205/102370_1 /TAXON_ID=73025 ORGANISM="Eutreptiella gymnastica-like, Strain CCMP1594" /NCGR_SAMPLE_ID=MMETSP0811_2 /ASSEMBLY_ACC=CAM_ASM_000667 /LENGTH=53 /DNA_ID=CAMNT_0015519187 /DNA_START=797 /DNA_END=958 /DNA_ORIENTATION=-
MKPIFAILSNRCCIGANSDESTHACPKKREHPVVKRVVVKVEGGLIELLTLGV